MSVVAAHSMGDTEATAAAAQHPVPDEVDTFRLDLGAPVVPRPVRWVVLAALGLIAVTRSPDILRYGRFWAEEGSIHFHVMMSRSFPNNILFVQVRTGYYNAFADWGTWLASSVPLRDAPLVTVWLSFALVMVTMWVALAWPSDLLPTAGARLAAAAVLLIGTLAIAEAWLNTINAQTYLGLTTLMLAFVRVDDMRLWRYGVGIGLLMLAGMSGLYSVALAPLFLVCGLLDHSRRRWGYAFTITAAGVIQALVLHHSRSSGQLVGSKVAIPGVSSIFRGLAGWHISGLLLPLNTVAQWTASSAKGRGHGTLELATVATVFLAFLCLLLWSTREVRIPLLLVGALLLVETLVQVGDLKGDAGGRYAVVPVGILSLMVIHGATRSDMAVLRRLGAATIVVVMAVGLSQFWTQTPQTLQCHNCPDWAAEVQSYESGTIRELQIWPYTRNWFVKLPPRHPTAWAAANSRKLTRRRQS